MKVGCAVWLLQRLMSQLHFQSVMSSESRLAAERRAVLPQPYRTLFMIIEVRLDFNNIQNLTPTRFVDFNSQEQSSQPC